MSDISSASGETDSHLDQIFPLNEEDHSQSDFSQIEHINSSKKQSQPSLSAIGAEPHSILSFPFALNSIEIRDKKSDTSQMEFDSDEDISQDSNSDLFADDGEEDTHQQAASLHPSSSAGLSTLGNAPLDLQKNTHHQKNHTQYEERKKPRAPDSNKIEDEEQSIDEEYISSQSFLDSSAEDHRQQDHVDNLSSFGVSFSQTGKMSNSRQRSNSTSHKMSFNKVKGNSQSHLHGNETNRLITNKPKENSQNDFSRNAFDVHKRHQYRRYQDFSSLILALRNFEWYDTSAFQNKLLPIKFLTPESFWFMVCSEYFPRSMVYQNEETVLKEINKKLERLPMELTNRACKYNAGKSSNNAISGAHNYSNEDNKEEEEELIQKEQENDEIQTKEKREEAGITQLDIEIDDLLRNQPVQQLSQARLSQTNKQFYNFDDDLFIVQNRMFLLDSMKSMNILEGQNEEVKLQELNKLDLDKLINLLTVSYQKQQKSTFKGFQKILSSMKQEFKEEQRVNDVKDIDFQDILVDLFTLNPIEMEFIQFLESKKQADNNNTSDQPINDNYQSQLNENNISQSSYQPLQSLQTTTPNRLVKQTEEAHCQVCNETDYADNDLIVFCSRCNLSVHQKCYGIPNATSQEDWICDACKSFGPSAQYLRCALCSKRGGALKRSKMPLQTTFFESLSPAYHEYLQTVIANSSQLNSAPSECFGIILFQFSIQAEPKTTKSDEKAWEAENKKKTKGEDTQQDERMEVYFDFQIEENRELSEQEAVKKEPVNLSHIWVHLTCALWVQECYFEERSSMNLVKGIESIDKKRFNLICSVCKQKNNGCCIQCAKGKCAASFHPECARRAGLSMEVRPFEKVSHQVFCQRHTPLKLRRILEQKEKKNKEEISKFCRSIEKYNETYFNEYKALCKEKQLKPSKALQRKAIKDQEKEDLEFMNCLSEHLLGVNSENEKEWFLDLEKMRQKGAQNHDNAAKGKQQHSHLKTQMTKMDEIWNQIEFKSYNQDYLYRMYKRLIKQKKSMFKGIFNTLKKNRDKLQEEMISRHLRQQKKEQMLLKKEQVLLEKEEKKKKNLKASENLKKLKREEPSADLQKRKYQQLNFPSEKEFREGYCEESGSQRIWEDSQSRKYMKVEQKDFKKLNRDDKVEQECTETEAKGYLVEEEKAYFCYCQNKYKEGEVMMQCAECEEWFHLECIGYIGTEAQAQTFDFCCNECNFDGKRNQNKDIYQNLFDPQQAKYSTFLKKIPRITVVLSTQSQSNNLSCLEPQEGNQVENAKKEKGKEQIELEQNEDLSGSYSYFSAEIRDTMKRFNVDIEGIQTFFRLRKNPQGVVSLVA